MLTQRTTLCVLAVLLIGGTLLGGCSRTPTAPASAEAAGSVETVHFEAKATSGSDSYKYTHSEFIVTDPLEADGRPGVGKNSHQVDMGSCCQGTDKIKLSAALISELDQLDECFDGLVGGTGYTKGFDFVGSIVKDRKTNEVRGNYWFDANGTGSGKNKTFHYRLVLTGTLDSGLFPPNPGDSNKATVSWTSAHLETEGKGKGSRGGNQGTSCAGSYLGNPAGGVIVIGFS